MIILTRILIQELFSAIHAATKSWGELNFQDRTLRRWLLRDAINWINATSPVLPIGDDSNMMD
jgi:hypothetical protein